MPGTPFSEHSRRPKTVSTTGKGSFEQIHLYERILKNFNRPINIWKISPIIIFRRSAGWKVNHGHDESIEKRFRQKGNFKHRWDRRL